MKRIAVKELSRKQQIILLIVIVCITLITSWWQQNHPPQQIQQPLQVYDEMQVHFIDVGQGDATLFVQNEHVMLFDTGPRNSAEELIEYIQNLGIEYIDVLVLTHPHDDHLGGASFVLDNFEVGIVYCPDISHIKKIKKYKWYQNLINSIKQVNSQRNQGLPEEEWTDIQQEPRYDNGEFARFNIGDATVEFLAPFEDRYSDENDYSICAKIAFGEIDMILTGDATDAVEKVLIQEGYDLDCEIFHASHHGSKTGNSKEFLDAMTPENIVISCGMGNIHDHPSESVVELYKNMKIPVYRTDESGTIVMTTNGQQYVFDKTSGTYTSGKAYNEKGE